MKRVKKSRAEVLAEIEQMNAAMRAKNPKAFDEAARVVRRRINVLGRIGVFGPVIQAAEEKRRV